MSANFNLKVVLLLMIINCFNKLMNVNALPLDEPKINEDSNDDTHQRFYHRSSYHPRPFFGSIGDLIGSTGFLPIEINVPDSISNVVNGIQSVTGGGQFGQIGNGYILNYLIQRFPFLQNYVRPRPYTSPYVFYVVPHENKNLIGNNNKNNNIKLTDNYLPLDEDLLLYP